MKNITQKLEINAKPEKVYAAIATEAGLKAWWTIATKAGESEGDSAEFKFHADKFFMKFNIDALNPNQAVRWTCQDATHTFWKETTVAWDLKENKGGTVLNFVHDKFAEENDITSCSAGWDYFLGSLKKYLETGKGSPNLNVAQ